MLHLPEPGQLEKFSKAGPRYTSYPTAPAFRDDFTAQDYAGLLGQNSGPVSLYFHIPFCESVCYFCACSVIYTQMHQKALPYLELLDREMQMVRSHFQRERLVDQLHLGGGTPTFLSPAELEKLWQYIRKYFSFTETAEISIELDPRETSPEHVSTLRELGFNRASMGIQDLDLDVQKAINRIQSDEENLRLYRSLRAAGFQGINFDLIYGLPRQTRQSFERTLDRVIELRPDRISLFNFAYVPWLKKHQRLIQPAELPPTDERIRIFYLAVERFLTAGYVYIGMDHFALPDDEIVLAQNEGSLRRNFQGYTTRRGLDLIGLGVTSIGEVASGYIQNHKTLLEYRRAIESDRLPVHRGLRKTPDDCLRSDIIMDLICNFKLSFAAIETAHNVDFRTAFSRELDLLSPFVEEGFVKVSDSEIQVTDTGRFVIRNICMVFDAYLDRLEQGGQRFSKTV
ncbi:MAG: oxygen-independent coproporphyrinogen III oxidase [Spirochaetales bacterium]|nr:oxygen-independent coproporphyrinogen III oxidase [Spirochaetales bacterium]